LSTDKHIRWHLWHGHVTRAVDLIGDTVETLDAMPMGVTRPRSIENVVHFRMRHYHPQTSDGLSLQQDAWTLVS
jgi:hypothetical protein